MVTPRTPSRREKAERHAARISPLVFSSLRATRIASDALENSAETAAGGVRWLFGFWDWLGSAKPLARVPRAMMMW